MSYWFGRFACRWLNRCNESCRGRTDHIDFGRKVPRD